MKLKLFFTPTALDENQMNGRTAVVCDVLRATTTAAVALTNGAREVIPVANLGDASSMKLKLDRSTVLLGGERDGQKVDGFDLGNSPFEYSPQIVEHKSVILASTNGSAALLCGSEAETCFSCAFVNNSAVVEEVLKAGNDIAVLCAGNKGDFSLEDTLCGGMLVHKLKNSASGIELENDAAWVALETFEKHKHNLVAALKECDHGKFLESLGFGQDVEFCSSEDYLEICPIWDSGRLVIKN